MDLTGMLKSSVRCVCPYIPGHEAEHGQHHAKQTPPSHHRRVFDEDSSRLKPLPVYPLRRTPPTMTSVVT